jgi:hypothetical protein
VTQIKKWRGTSPSQISTFRDCARKWWRISVNGERQPSSPAAERGSRVHEQIEAYLEHGTQPTDGAALAMLPNLPEAGTVAGELIEVAFAYQPEGWPVPIRGRVDLLDPESGRIIDHKTTASLSYAKSAEMLPFDPQAIAYSAAALEGALGVDIGDGERIKFRLSYGTTRGASRALVVERELTKGEILEGLEVLGATVRAQWETSQIESWGEVAQNLESCSKYGGCPFRADCTMGPPLKESEKMSLKEKLAARRAEQSGGMVEIPAGYGANPPDGLPAGAPVPESAEEKKRRLRRDALKWDGKSISALKKGEAQEALDHYLSHLSPAQRAEYDARGYAEKTLSDLKTALGAIDLLLQGEPLPEREEEPNEQPAPPTAQPDLLAGLLTPEPATPPPPPEAERPQDPPPAPRAAPAKEPAQETVKAPEDPEEQAFLASLPLYQRILLIDCAAPSAVEAERALHPMILEVEERAKMPISLIKYNEGWNELAASVARRGWDSSFQGAQIVRCDSMSPLYRSASHVLHNLADLVIRSSR